MFTCKASDLKGVLDHASKVAQKNSNKGLNHCVLQTNCDGVFLRANNNSLHLEMKFPAEIEEHCEVAIDFQELHRLAKAVKKDELIVYCNSHKDELILSTGKLEFAVCLPTPDLLEKWKSNENDFMGDSTLREKFSIPASLLFECLSKCEHSISQEETRYYLGGVNLERTAEEVIFTSTDGHRLTHLRKPCTSEEGHRTIMIPGALVETLLRLLKEEIKNRKGEDFAMQYTVRNPHAPDAYPGLLIFEASDWKASAKEIEGRFPDYRQVIPTNQNADFILLKKDFQEALKTVMLASPDKTGGIRFKLDNNGLHMEASSSGKSRAKQTLEGVLEIHDEKGLKASNSNSDEIQAFEVGMNGNYLLDVVKNHDAEELVLSFTNFVSPLKIQTGNDLFVVMPMRL